MVSSARVESQADQAAAAASLATDDTYFDLIEQARDMVAGPAQDRLVTVIHGTPGTPPALGAVVQMTTATAAIDQLAATKGLFIPGSAHVSQAVRFV